MKHQHEFQGFSPATVNFFRELAIHNDKPWFEKNRPSFDREVMAHAQRFVSAMGDRLRTISPDVNAIPRIDKSIFRIYRDTRFSKDKSPYKTHLGIFFWEGPFKKLENSGYYFQLSATSIFMGVGLHNFPKHVLEAYREAVVDPAHGPALVEAVRQVSSNGYQIGGEKYKKVPRGYDAEHPLAEWLFYKGIYAFYESPHPPEMFTAAFPDWCFEHFRKMAPLHHWMRELTLRI